HAEIEERREKLRSGGAPVAEAAHEETIEFSAITPFDLADETEASRAIEPFKISEPHEPPFIVEESQPEPVSAVQQPQPSTQPAIDPGLAAIFDEFRTAVEDEEPALADGDYETHYNLGLAYKEMDLMDEAIEELQSAASIASPRDGTPRYLQCCNLLGHCFMQKDMPQVAAMWFQKGLEAPGHTEDEYQALRFELGTAYEKMGDLERAIKTFTEVYGINVTYRGVANKLRELQKDRK
ncbi:MAG TPA: tetratricopeptide repeat protein, partial [Pyrinomonadaceae bacterium]|nr:tetratricopeptide repeat protein [Pyrinomonadaceae bacterium]